MRALQRCPPRNENFRARLHRKTLSMMMMKTKLCLRVERRTRSHVKRFWTRELSNPDSALHSKMSECHRYLQKEVSFVGAVTSPSSWSAKITAAITGSKSHLQNRAQKIYARIARDGKKDSAHSALLFENNACGRGHFSRLQHEDVTFKMAVSTTIYHAFLNKTSETSPQERNFGSNT